MVMKEVKKIIKHVLYNPQVSYPPISYKIEDVSSESYRSSYMDEKDFKTYLKRLEKRLIYRLDPPKRTK